MAKMPNELRAALEDSSTLKIFATIDQKDQPNVIVLGSLLPLDEETIAFGDVLLGKTKRNLLDNGKYTAVVYKSPKEAYQIKGRMEGYIKEGDDFTRINEHAFKLLKKESFGAGILKVEEVYSVGVGNPGEKLV